MSFSLKEERELAEAMHLLMPLHFFYEQDRRTMPALFVSVVAHALGVSAVLTGIADGITRVLQ